MTGDCVAAVDPDVPVAPFVPFAEPDDPDVPDVPLPVESPLRTHPKVVALPHIGSATHETRYAMAEMAVTNLLQVLEGEKPAGWFDLGKA